MLCLHVCRLWPMYLSVHVSIHAPWSPMQQGGAQGSKQLRPSRPGAHAWLATTFGSDMVLMLRK